MKIISKFRDYYDSALQFGHDESLLYVRKEEFIQPEPSGKVKEFFGPFSYPKPGFIESIGQRLQDGLETEGFLILFCGKYYRGLKMWYGSWSPNETTQYHYDTQSAIAFIRKHKIAQTYSHRGYLISGGVTERSLENYFEDNSNPLSDGLKRNIEMNCPVIFSSLPGVYKNTYENTGLPHGTWHHVVKNPCLKQLGFFRVMDATMAYQELSMFLGGIVANKETSMVEVSEKTRIEKRGFDKWSFRTMPTKKVG